MEPLGRTLRLGSVGYFTDGQWVEATTTAKMFGLHLSPSPGSDAPNTFDGKSGKGFSFAVKGDGVTSGLMRQVADAHLRAEITFGSRDAFVMSVRNQAVQVAQELAELMAAIRWAFRHRRKLTEGKRWEKKYAVIIGIASAESVTAVSASSSKAAVAVEGSGKLAPPSQFHGNRDRSWCWFRCRAGIGIRRSAGNGLGDATPGGVTHMPTKM